MPEIVLGKHAPRCVVRFKIARAVLCLSLIDFDTEAQRLVHACDIDIDIRTLRRWVSFSLKTYSRMPMNALNGVLSRGALVACAPRL